MFNSILMDPDVNPENFPYLNSLIQSDTWKCVTKNHFPKTNILRKNKIEELALVQLLYLASIKKDSDKSVFSKKHFLVLKKSDEEAIGAVRWLNFGFCGAVFGVVASAYLALIPTNNFTPPNCTTTESTGSSPGTPTILISTGIALIAVAVTYVAWKATGWMPDSSSNAYNDKQDLFRPLSDIFNELSNRLVKLYFTTAGNEEAYKIATYIDLDKIQEQFALRIPNPETIESIIGRFKEAVLFVRSQGQISPTRSDLLSYIELLEQILPKPLEAIVLRQRVENEEVVIDL